MKFIQNNQSISEPLAALLHYFSIDTNQPVQEIVRITQKQWLLAKRKQNIQNKMLLSSDLRELFADLGMVNAICPIQKQYDYILLLGSDVPDMRARIAFLDELIKKGVRSSQILVLCSDRPLYEYEQTLASAHTEKEMIQKLLSTIDTKNWPPIKNCIAYGKTNTDGSHQRAITEDTVKAWLATKPQPGTVLIISQQPYIGRQHAVMETYLKDGWSIETVGPQLAADFYLEDMLDTLARWLYPEYQNLR